MEENTQTQEADAGSILTAQEVDTSTTEVKETKQEATVPEVYSDFVLPEGMEVDAELLNDFKPLAKELGLTQEKAQKLVDLQSKYLQKMGDVQTKAWETTVDGWRQATEQDKEFGGAALKENVGKARVALDKFGTKELRDALDVTGVGNHPEFVRFMVRVGKAISEDTMRSGTTTSGPRDPAKTLFPNMN